MFKKYRRSIFKKIFRRTQEKGHLPTIIQKQHHSISPTEISASAIKVMQRLNKEGFSAYLVGGGVRDMLLGKHPKDFDIVTDARPQEVRRIFRNSRLIGRRFRLVHVYFPEEIVEVSTFRAYSQVAEPSVSYDVKTENKAIRILSEDNTYGTIEEDVWRRDFTVNALYYDIRNHSVLDFTGGLSDLQRCVLRMIGDPAQRFHEDPVRLLRAIRLAAKLDFSIDPVMEAAILNLRDLLHHVPQARLFMEFLKIFFKGHADASYQRLKVMGYMDLLFPNTMAILAQSPQAPSYEALIHAALAATDRRYHHKETLNPGFLLSILLWPVVQEKIKISRKKKRLFSALHEGILHAFQVQREALSIPRRLLVMMRSVWILQYHLERRRRARIWRIFSQRYFRAAFDFLELRAQSEERLQSIAAWWRAFRDGDEAARNQLMSTLS